MGGGRFENQMRRERAKHWVYRLYEEYDHLCFTFHLRLKRPVLQVEDLGSRWGLWDPVTRTLTLSTVLIESYPWEIVLEVLKHELAHQMVTDEFDSDEGHGPCFRACCQRLGMAEWACQAETDLKSYPLTQAKVQPISPEEERLLQRVEKLLALATSSNEHEALLAMERVQELYAKYNLDRLKEKRAAKLVYLIIQTHRKRVERYHFLICSILNEHFFVQVIHSTQYHPHDLCDYKVIELLGTQENVLMAEYVYHFLLGRVNALWNQYRQATGKLARSRSSYILGVLSGFREKLETHRLQKEEAARATPGAENPWALVVQEDRDLERFVRYRYPRLVSIRRGRRMHDADSFDAGKEEGLRLVLHRAVTETQGNQGRLLKG